MKMRNFIVLDDNIAHTAIFLVKAENKKEALEKYVVGQLSVEKKSSTEWFVRDYGNSKFNKTYKSLEEFIKEEYSHLPSFRLEIKEVSIDPNNDMQLIFLSDEKKIH